MRRILCWATMLLVVALPLSLSAQNNRLSAEQVLQKTAERYRAAEGIRAKFTVTVSGSDAQEGEIMLSGEKFKVKLQSGFQYWYDGKSLWVLDEYNEEVSISSPSAAEMQAVNPYSFLTLDKRGYKLTMLAQKEYELTFAASNAKTEMQRVSIGVSRNDYAPKRIEVTYSNGQKLYFEISSLETKQNFKNSIFTFSPKDYPGYEVIDMR